MTGKCMAGPVTIREGERSEQDVTLGLSWADCSHHNNSDNHYNNPRSHSACPDPEVQRSGGERWRQGSTVCLLCSPAWEMSPRLTVIKAGLVSVCVIRA